MEEAVVTNIPVLAACLVAIVVAILLNFVWKMNMGMMAMAFAFIIGCLMMKLPAADIYGFWPDNLVFFMLASALFYGYARANGTLQNFGSKVLWRFRHAINSIPWVFMLIAFILGILGAGPGTIVLLAPIGFSVARQIGMDPLLMVFAIDSGYNCGTQNPWTGTGVVMYGLVESNVGGDTALAFSTYLRSYVLFVGSKIIMMLLFYLYFAVVKKGIKGAAGEAVVLDHEPEAYTPVQKKTFALILISFGLLVIPNILSTLKLVNGDAFKTFLKICKPHAILIIFAVVAMWMNLADTKEVMKRLPINTVFIISGVAFLMEIARLAGLMEAVTSLFSDHFPAALAAPIFAFLAAFLSIFASGTSVVLPLLYPMVPGLAAATGINVIAFYTAAQVGALATPISPFSTAGAQFVSLAPDDLSESLVKRQFVLALIMMVLNTLLMLVGYGYILKI